MGALACSVQSCFLFFVSSYATTVVKPMPNKLVAKVRMGSNCREQPPLSPKTSAAKPMNKKTSKQPQQTTRASGQCDESISVAGCCIHTTQVSGGVTVAHTAYLPTLGGCNARSGSSRVHQHLRLEAVLYVSQTTIALFGCTVLDRLRVRLFDTFRIHFSKTEMSFPFASPEDETKTLSILGKTTSRPL